jgi:hypothetical protein
MKRQYRRLCYWIHTHTDEAVSLAYAAGLLMWALQAWWLWLTKGA